MIWLYFLIYAIAFGALSAIAVKSKNRDQAGWFLIGFFFGVFGLVAAVLIDKIPESERPQKVTREFDASALTKQCPDCAETIKLQALVCRFCHHKFVESEVRAQIDMLKREFEKQNVRPQKAIIPPWECTVCHKLNQLGGDTCEQCSAWRCTWCYVVNSSDQARCTGCTAPRNRPRT